MRGSKRSDVDPQEGLVRLVPSPFDQIGTTGRCEGEDQERSGERASHLAAEGGRLRLGNIKGMLGPAGTGGPTRGHAIARMNTPSRQNAGDREGHVAAS